MPLASGLRCDDEGEVFSVLWTFEVPNRYLSIKRNKRHCAFARSFEFLSADDVCLLIVGFGNLPTGERAVPRRQ